MNEVFGRLFYIKPYVKLEYLFLRNADKALVNSFIAVHSNVRNKVSE